MRIVRLALRRPYTFMVGLLIVLLGVVTIQRTPTDIFPEVSIPVVSVIWSLAGISVDDIERRVITTVERARRPSILRRAAREPTDQRLSLLCTCR